MHTSLSEIKEAVISIGGTMSIVARHAITAVLHAEQGYVNDPSDNGGETNFGISKRQYPELDIANLTLQKAAVIYYGDYWLKNKCGKLSPSLGTILFDCAVNQGGTFARKTLQKSIGVKVDGVIGEKTLAAAARQTVLNNPLAPIRFTRLRCQHYTNLVQSDVTQVKYIEGWIERAFQALEDSRKLTT